MNFETGIPGVFPEGDGRLGSMKCVAYGSRVNKQAPC